MPDAAAARLSEAAAAAPRIVAAGAEEALQRFNDVELLAAGKVNVISLEAVQGRFGPRWESAGTRRPRVRRLGDG